MPRIYLERRDMNDELRRLFDLLEIDAAAAGRGAECNPPVDVLESDTRVEITIDLPGVRKEHVQVAIARGSVLVAGAKGTMACSHADATFHLAERAFGRFARVVRVAGALDAGRAKAVLAAGELRIVVPRIEERRGREIHIPVETA